MKKHAMANPTLRRIPAPLARAHLAAVIGGTEGTIIVENLLAGTQSLEPGTVRIKETVVAG